MIQGREKGEGRSRLKKFGFAEPERDEDLEHENANRGKEENVSEPDNLTVPTPGERDGKGQTPTMGYVSLFVESVSA
jgi:hypothetical protein